MTAISAATSGIPTFEAPPLHKPVGKQELDRSDFMTLFITQLQYQDPMKPMDSYEMASQLAQFSNMEATMKMSNNMEELLDYQKSQNNLQLLSLIGKEVETSGSEIGVLDGKPATTRFILEEAAVFNMAYIYDAAGKLTRTLDLGYRNAGAQSLAWDGLDNNGNPAADGLYTYQVDAVSVTGANVGVEKRAAGRVTGVEFDSGQATVTVNGYAKKGVGEIITVNEAGRAIQPPVSEPDELPADEAEEPPETGQEGNEFEEDLQQALDQ